MKHLFDYLNYRDYLRDHYSEKKKAHSFYSFRLFSQQAGFTSPNFIKLVIDNKRNCSVHSIEKFCHALRLNKKETDYFQNLVQFNQSKSLAEKNRYLTCLMKYRRKLYPEKIEESSYAYYSAWYHPVIRELAGAVDFMGDYSRLARCVVPSVSAREARRSVNLLLKLGFLRTRGKRFERTSRSLTTGPVVNSVSVANYHKEMMQRAAESIERFSASQRDVSSLTLSVSENTYALIVEKIRSLRAELLRCAEADETPERVVQVNFQAFPLSRRFSELPGEES